MSAFRPVVATAGILLATSDILQGATSGTTFSDQVVRPTYVAGSFIGLVGCFVLALALLQIHRRVGDRTGRGGLIAALAAGFGVMLLAAVNWSTSFVDPAAAKTYPAFINDTPPAILVAGYFATLLWFGLSWVVYAVVAMRSGALARRPLAILLIGALASALPFVPFGMVAFGMALVWLGLAPARAQAPLLVPAN
jgi:hypothetical protein